MKKFWLSVAVGAVAALALQATSAQFADPDPNTAPSIAMPPMPMYSPVIANDKIVDPWSNNTAV